eukprot:2934910-Karenia_brevis.AAC.1
MGCMEHPEVPWWDRKEACGCDPRQPHACDHVISSFAIPEIRYLSGLPGAFPLLFDVAVATATIFSL